MLDVSETEELARFLVLADLDGLVEFDIFSAGNGVSTVSGLNKACFYIERTFQ